MRADFGRTVFGALFKFQINSNLKKAGNAAYLPLGLLGQRGEHRIEALVVGRVVLRAIQSLQAAAAVKMRWPGEVRFTAAMIAQLGER